uniref:Uncharacterized protein n=1 Tax=Rhizophora mucronata TaxID=61149 RepID=A0A2P2QAR8_RHIMU
MHCMNKNELIHLDEQSCSSTRCSWSLIDLFLWPF